MKKDFRNNSIYHQEIDIDVAKDFPDVMSRIFQEGRIVSHKEVEVTLKSPEDGVIGEVELKRLGLRRKRQHLKL